MKIAILGFGREGKSTLKFLQGASKFKDAEITILDRKRNPRYLEDLSQFDVIFRSPGIPYNLPELKKARSHGVRFSSATRLFFEHCPATIIGVTGTKGKGTTSMLLYKIFISAGKEAYIAGNIGIPMLDMLPKLKKRGIAILELSSFQLQDLNVSPPTAVVLDVFPDHQDSHLSLREYYNAKAVIAKYQRPVDNIFFFKHNKMSSWIASKSRGEKVCVDEHAFTLFSVRDLKIKGLHNFKNAAMAAIVAKQFGVSDRTIVEVARNYRGLEHRLELAKEIRTRNGIIAFYNDSASTNPQTTSAAIRAFPHDPLILIAGGKDKGLDYGPLSQALKNSSTKLAILFGENKKKILRSVRSAGTPTKMVRDLKTAVSAAYRSALALKPNTHNPAPIVLFSPAAASFDMFKDYADRGRQFKKFVKDLKSR